MQVSGIVESKSRNGTGVKINGVWYNGTTDQLVGVEWKAQATIEVDAKNKVTAVVGASAPAASTSPAAGGGSGGGYDARQDVILFQSARNAAVDLFGKLHDAGAIKLPTKEADRMDAALAFVSEQTVMFYEESSRVFKGEDASAVLSSE